MKQLIRALAAVLLVSFLLLYVVSKLNSAQGYTSGNTLTIYNWGDYIDPKLIDRFEKETGIKVIYETFDSNEAMMTKIEQGGTAYDIAVPSEYAIQKMKEENLLLPIDHSKIPNLKYIDPRFLNLPLIRATNIQFLIFGERSESFIIKTSLETKRLQNGMIYGTLN